MRVYFCISQLYLLWHNICNLFTAHVHSTDMYVDSFYNEKKNNKKVHKTLTSSIVMMNIYLPNNLNIFIYN